MNVCFVSEQGPHIGGGHISRQYSIAEWLTEYSVSIDLYTNNLDGHFIDKFIKIGAQPFIVNINTDNFVPDSSCINKYQWCFIDGDQISNEYELLIKKQLNCTTIRITDVPIHYHHSDILINQNYDSDNFKYDDVPGQIRFFGLKHVMLQKIVRDTICGQLTTNKQKLITISLGNSVSEQSCAIIRRLIEYFSADSFDEFSFNIFTNSPIECFKTESLGDNIHIKAPSDAFIKSIKYSEFVLCSVGTTMWECMALGTPFVAIPLNDVQAKYIESLEVANICITLSADTILTRQYELGKVLAKYLNQKTQIEYQSIFETLLPSRYFSALEKTLGLV
jgi:spore coat polysaccharide biosynthesis predicted glycosyltransferase SpsG